VKKNRYGGSGTCRVLVAHPSYELYGSDRMLVESVRALTDAGCAVTVAIPQDGPLSGPLRATGADVAIVPTVVLRKAFMSPLGLLRLVAATASTLPAMLRAIRRSRPDVVYVNTVTIPLWLMAARLMRKPVMCHVHEAEEGVARPVAWALTAPLLLARRVLVNSQSAAAIVAAAVPALRSRITLLYNGVAGPPTAATPPRATLDGPLRAVLVGRLSPRKGTDVAVAAVAELARRGVDVRIEFVGEVFPGYEWFEAQVRAQAEADAVSERVTFTGFESDVWPLLAAADIVLVPSRVEPFGNVAVEAALACRPVIASAVQGLQEIVVPGVTGLSVPPGDPVALADAIDELRTDWARALSLAENAARDAEKRFGQERYARELRAAFRDFGLPLSQD